VTTLDSSVTRLPLSGTESIHFSLQDSEIFTRTNIILNFVILTVARITSFSHDVENFITIIFCMQGWPGTCGCPDRLTILCLCQGDNLAPVKPIFFELFWPKQGWQTPSWAHAQIPDNFQINFFTCGKPEFTVAVSLTILVAY